MTTRNSAHQWENCRSEKTKDRDYSLSRISYFEEQTEIEWRMMKKNGISSWAMRARLVIVPIQETSKLLITILFPQQ